MLLRKHSDEVLVKIIDLGLSKNYISFEMSSSCGTEHFAAPELIWREPYTNKVDSYSIGMMVEDILNHIEETCSNLEIFKQLKILSISLTQVNPADWISVEEAF